MRLRKREIARAGIYGAAENPQIVSAKDIEEIAETFPDIRRAPIRLGHGAADSPRLGNVVSVRREGDALCADIEEHDALAAAVDSGYYPDVSIGARQRAQDGKMYLHHLAYLGQEPPAIKDLIAEIREPLEIAAADTGTDGLVLLPSPSGFRMNLSEPIHPAKENATVTEDEARKLREENDRLKSELDRRELALADSMQKQAAADTERLKAALQTAKIPAVQRDRFLQIAAALAPGKTIELSDGAGGTEKMSGIDALIKTVSAIPPPVQEGAFNLGDPADQNHGKRDYSRLRSKG